VPHAPEARAPSFGELLKVFGRIGVLSFGGPTAQLAMMHKVLVEERKWLDADTYLHALNFCMLLPGPEAMQLATYAGWRLHGVRGGLAAGLLFVIPGALVVLGLAMLYAEFGKVPIVTALFLGIKAAVLVIVLEALLRVARRGLKLPMHWLIAAISFVALFFFAVPFPIVILAAGIVGFFTVSGTAPAAAATGPLPVMVSWQRTLGMIAFWGAAWWLPVLVSALVLGPDHVVTTIGVFFSKLAVVTFGGAYSVLAYMAQAVVATHQWLSAGEMMDGLGLAETTPGPLILVTQFVGYLAAYRHSGMPGIGAGLLGAAMTLWVTFVPCFLWIFAGAPYLEHIRRMPRLSGALAAITAAVIGVILNLSLWFALHVLFTDVRELHFGPMLVQWPTIASFDWVAALLAIIAGIALLRMHLGIATALAISASLALAIHFGRLWLGA
jgi:chromate transporter